MSNEAQYLKAITEHGRIVHINDVERRTSKNENLIKYYCPICGKEMIPHKGEIRAHHFVHKGKCTETWNHDKSEWHKEWQAKFPDECQEIYMESNGKKHIADVLYNGIVFEFQHSPISKEEFEDRNTFYNSLGYPVIWLFDISGNRKNKETIREELGGVYWENPFETFKGYVCEKTPVCIYFEYSIDEDKLIRKLKALSKPYERLEFDEQGNIFEGESFQDDFINSFYSDGNAIYKNIPGCMTLYDIIEKTDPSTYAFVTQNMMTNQMYMVVEGGKQLSDCGKVCGVRCDGIKIDNPFVFLTDLNYPFWILGNQYDKRTFEIITGQKKPTVITSPQKTVSYMRGPIERYLLKNGYTNKKSKTKYGNRRK